MSKYLHSIYKGRHDVSLQPTEDAAHKGLAMALDRHKGRDERGKDFMFGPRFAVEIWDVNGETIGKYWLSDDESSSEPTEADGPRVKV